jgi:hypothetical protein
MLPMKPPSMNTLVTVMPGPTRFPTKVCVNVCAPFVDLNTPRGA